MDKPHAEVRTYCLVCLGEIVGTAVVAIGMGFSNWKTIHFSILRFCQHYTGEGYKSEEHLQTESKM
jgi:hypothetical protein